MEALSPFFKKKAHILEVLRKMEETDPLKFHPSSAGLSFCDYSQVLMSTEAVLATATAAAADPLPCKPHHTHCRCSCSDAAAADTHQHVNGDGAVSGEGGNACCSHCKRSPETAKPPCGHVCSSAPKAAAATAAECHSKSRAADKPAPSPPQQVDPSLEEAEPEQDRPPASSASHCDLEPGGGVHNGDAVLDEPSEQDGGGGAAAEQEASSSVRASASVSPSSSCLSDVKAAAINSPSKLLKFLKIPSMGDKSPAAGATAAVPNATGAAAVRLSPQLTRSSRIPCRTNNYEVKLQMIKDP